MWLNRSCINDRLVDQRERKPDVTHSEECSRKHSQDPRAFTQAKHLRCAVQSHRENHQYPQPPGDTGQALFAQHKNQAHKEHRGIDGKVAFAHSKLVPENVERV